MKDADILATVDRRRFAEIVARWEHAECTPADENPAEERREKYLDLPMWVRANLRRVRRIGLHDGHRRRVLDLGCGCGYFLYVCKLLGHEVVGIDRKERRSLFTEVRELLGVPWVAHSIRAGEPLPDLGRFDVVTAHMVTFNGHRSDSLWGADEWGFLLDELEARLCPNGIIAIELNREPSGLCYTADLERLLRSRGAEIDGHRVVLRR